MWGKDFRDIPYKSVSLKRRHRRRHDKGWNAAEKSRTMRDPEGYVPESHCRAARIINYSDDGRSWYDGTNPTARIIHAQIMKYGAKCPEDILSKVRKDCGPYSAIEQNLSCDIRNMTRALSRNWYRVSNPPRYSFLGSYPNMAFYPLTTKPQRKKKNTANPVMYSVRLSAFHFLLNEYGDWYIADCRAQGTAPAVVNDNRHLYFERVHPTYRASNNYHFDVVWKRQLSRESFNHLCQKLTVANRPSWEDGDENKNSG